MSHCRFCAPTRRNVLAFGAAALLTGTRVSAADDLPAEVAGVALPRSPFARKAAAYSKASCPDFLFNHSMRTFLFGAISIGKLGKTCNADEAFAAAAIHDFGLLKAFESERASFEVDSADKAEAFARQNGINAPDADVIWHAVVFHDGRFAITKRAGPEAMLVAMGAGADVVGPGDDIDRNQVAEIVAAFPRLGFKKRFTDLAIDHCRRKPASQRGTWLEGLCREQVPSAFPDTVEQEIAQAPFAE